MTLDGAVLAGTDDAVLTVAGDVTTSPFWQPAEGRGFADAAIAVSRAGELLASFLGRVRLLQPGCWRRTSAPSTARSPARPRGSWSRASATCSASTGTEISMA